jgi:hypothetical protein
MLRDNPRAAECLAKMRLVASTMASRLARPYVPIGDGSLIAGTASPYLTLGNGLRCARHRGESEERDAQVGEAIRRACLSLNPR